ENAFTAAGDVVRHHPGYATSSRGPSRRIFAVVEEHSGMEPSTGVDSLARHKIQEAASAAGKIFLGASCVDLQALQLLQRLHRRDRVGQTSRHGLDGHGVVKVAFV